MSTRKPRLDIIPGMRNGKILTEWGYMTPEEYQDFVDDYMTDDEFNAIMKEIRDTFEELKKHGIKNIRFTCKEG